MELEQVKALLPDSVITIAELIGFPATAELLRVLGGTTFPVGKGLRAMGAGRAKLLKETIGEDNARLMTAHFGGEVLYLPRCDRALRELRNRAFLGEFDNLKKGGLSTPRIMTTLCPKYGFTDRFAWRLIASHRNTAPNHSQQNLF